MNQRINLVKEKWKSIGLPIKIAIGTALLALIIYLMFIIFAPDRYQVLYSGLEEKDRTEIEKFLSDKGIDYTVNPETSAISVDGNIIDIKKNLALEGLPKSGSAIGLEQFSSMSIGSTQSDKNVQYQNAIQEELNGSLQTMFEGISSADVKVPLSEEENIFSEENTAIQVSVALKLRDGYELSPKQVKAVQVYVAGALKDVLPENVQVVDQFLNPLSSEETTETGVNKQTQIAEETKKKMEAELTSSLSEVYGKVKVIVNVDINFDEIVQNIKSYAPQGTVISREENRENKSSITGDELAIPGTDENGEVPNYETVDTENQQVLSTENKNNIIENFVVSETVEQIIKQPELRNTNISVWFDDTSLTQMDLYNAEELVAVASGLTGAVNRVANDKAVYQNGSVKVIKKEFFTNEGENTEKENAEEAGILSNLPWYVYLILGILTLIGIVAIIILIRRSKQQKLREMREASIAEDEMSSSQGNEDIFVENTSEEEDEILSSLEEKFQFELNEQQKDLRKLTNDIARKYPKETADVIRKIMKEQ